MRKNADSSFVHKSEKKTIFVSPGIWTCKLLGSWNCNRISLCSRLQTRQFFYHKRNSFWLMKPKSNHLSMKANMAVFVYKWGLSANVETENIFSMNTLDYQRIVNLKTDSYCLRTLTYFCSWIWKQNFLFHESDMVVFFCQRIWSWQTFAHTCGYSVLLSQTLSVIVVTQLILELCKVNVTGSWDILSGW
jgi:hypothetical protein